jgi:hypothetical protein
MLERIADALELDSSELFSRTPFSSASIWQFKKEVLSDLEKAVSDIVTQRIKKLKNREQ